MPAPQSSITEVRQGPCKDNARRGALRAWPEDAPWSPTSQSASQNRVGAFGTSPADSDREQLLALPLVGISSWQKSICCPSTREKDFGGNAQNSYAARQSTDERTTHQNINQRSRSRSPRQSEVDDSKTTRNATDIRRRQVSQTLLRRSRSSSYSKCTKRSRRNSPASCSCSESQSSSETTQSPPPSTCGSDSEQQDSFIELSDSEKDGPPGDWNIISTDELVAKSVRASWHRRSYSSNVLMRVYHACQQAI